MFIECGNIFVPKWLVPQELEKGTLQFLEHILDEVIVPAAAR